MHDVIAARLYNQVMLNRAYLKTILANQCIILANQSGNTDHRLLYEKVHQQVFREYKDIISQDKKSVDPPEK